MSNFDTFTPLTAGVPGTAPVTFNASTEDDLVTVTAVGYLNDKAAEKVVKRLDIVQLNYLATTDDLATAEAATFYVEVAGNDYSLVAYP